MKTMNNNKRGLLRRSLRSLLAMTGDRAANRQPGEPATRRTGKPGNRLTLAVLVLSLLLTATAHANNISVSNTVLGNQDVGAGTVEVSFNLAWDNPFSGTDANSAAFYDRAWVFVKYWVVGTDSESTGWHHATLTSGGTVTPVSGGKGAFISSGAGHTVKWNYAGDGVSASDEVKVKVCAVEMVYVPEGEFVYNAGGIGGSSYNNYGAGAQTTVSSTGDIPAGAAAGWPNGYSAFYIMKYEVSQGQYADFLNTLSAANASNLFGSYTDYEHTITYTGGNPYGSRYAASAPNRASARISWDDAKTYASWAALRPMTEMEFEKAARGGGAANTNIYPWGNTDPATGNSVYTPSGHTSPYSAWSYYANFVTGSNVNGEDGPSDVGLYLSGDLGRTDAQTGASIYGVVDLAGNLWEHLINCASLTVPANGDGGIASPASWPPASAGKGFRGGSWYNGTTSLRVSDRDYAGTSNTDRYYSCGFRGARTP